MHRDGSHLCTSDRFMRISTKRTESQGTHTKRTLFSSVGQACVPRGISFFGTAVLGMSTDGPVQVPRFLQNGRRRQKQNRHIVACQVLSGPERADKLRRAGIHCALRVSALKQFYQGLAILNTGWCYVYPNARFPNTMEGYDEVPAFLHDDIYFFFFDYAKADVARHLLLIIVFPGSLRFELPK